ncbi:MAG: hypothetical protein LBE38_02160, partial [Deltaproteobacteria bacterium]|nr:hypothetical protein [Deltaproteobacteria bacterium]
WSIARLEALTAGFNLAQDDISQRKAYEPAPPSNLLKVAGIDLIASGDIDPEEKLPFAEYETPESYRKVVVNLSGVLVGFTNLGTTKGNKELGLALGKKTIPQDILEDLKRPDFDFKRLESL